MPLMPPQAGQPLTAANSQAIQTQQVQRPTAALLRSPKKKKKTEELPPQAPSGPPSAALLRGKR